ncbi:MAG: gliding motility-associated protein GldE [Bacteroidales bacterium]|nr:gliding motility-associated protein GldE [Bacteroidales bacterium]
MEPSEPFPLALIVSVKIIFQTNDLFILISILTTCTLLLIKAILTGVRIAYFSLKPDQIKKIEQQKDYRSKLIIKHLKNPKKTLATLIFTNTFISICFIVAMGIFLNLIFDFTKFPITGFLIQISIIATLYLLFGNIGPKTLANNKPERFSKRSAILVNIFDKLFHPFCMLLIKHTSIIDQELATVKQHISLDDLSHALNLTKNQITEDENILKGIVKFGNIDAKEIMKSRVDFFAIEDTTLFKDLLTNAIESGHSRIPIYTETIDNIKGILFIKDLLPHIEKDNTFKWQSLIRTPHLVPENKKINVLLQEFQTNKIHMAIVIDEYGGTSGIVTLEDVIEEIVGDIVDESDEEDEIIYSTIDKNTYLFEGKTLLNDFIKIVDIEDDLFDDVKGDADTIAGLILELTGEIPEKNKKIDFKNLTFTIESVDKRRIKQIKVTLNS